MAERYTGHDRRNDRARIRESLRDRGVPPQRLIEEGDVPPNVDRVLSKPPKLRELRDAIAEVAAASGALDSREL